MRPLFYTLVAFTALVAAWSCSLRDAPDFLDATTSGADVGGSGVAGGQGDQGGNQAMGTTTGPGGSSGSGIACPTLEISWAGNSITAFDVRGDEVLLGTLSTEGTSAALIAGLDGADSELLNVGAVCGVVGAVAGDNASHYFLCDGTLYQTVGSGEAIVTGPWSGVLELRSGDSTPWVLDIDGRVFEVRDGVEDTIDDAITGIAAQGPNVYVATQLLVGGGIFQDTGTVADTPTGLAGYEATIAWVNESGELRFTSNTNAPTTLETETIPSSIAVNATHIFYIRRATDDATIAQLWAASPARDGPHLLMACVDASDEGWAHLRASDDFVYIGANVGGGSRVYRLPAP